MKYCEYCGWIIADNSMDYEDEICVSCKNKFKEDSVTSEIFNSYSDDTKEQYCQIMKNYFKQSPHFNKEKKLIDTPKFYMSFWFDKYEKLTGKVGHRTGKDYEYHLHIYYEKLAAKQAEEERQRIAYEATLPHCPTCNSTNLTKISGTSKAVSVAMFGLLSQKVKHQFKCKNCGYEF